MPKDSQPDNKKVKAEKVNHQTPLTAENQNHNPNKKKHSIQNGIDSHHGRQANG